mgnify:CR=1 FL=1
MPNKNAFTLLNKVDVSNHTKKKGKFTYLSWAWAVRELLKVDPGATWCIHEYEHNVDTESSYMAPYMHTTTGCYVKVTVTLSDSFGNYSRTQIHPVLNHMNKTINNPTSFDINTSIQRCLAKAIALHGLGLYIYAGEDLPIDSSLDEDELANLNKLIKGCKDPYVGASWKKKINTINKSNYDETINKLEELQK